ncbi:MAG TPA: ATP-binding protein [Humisphaera sp.]|nr:ATP-binding protein [Humisphaera sp.]
MHGLRSKILVGFGGLLLMLVAVSLLGETVLNRYSSDMQRSFREDYQSVESCEDLAHAAYRIDVALQLHLQQGVPLNVADMGSSIQICNRQLEAQSAIATLAGEKEATERLARRWDEYKKIHVRLLDPAVPLSQRQADYSRLSLPKAIEVQAAAHELINMNLGHMLSVHARVREMAGPFRWAMHALTVSATVLSVMFALLIGRFILRPVRALTDSVRQIEHGNLDFRVPIQSKDELGVLGAAVNAMAAQLKAYRQADRDRLIRTERTTQLAIDSLPDAVIVVNLAGRIELANETAKRLFHLTPGASVAEMQSSWLTELHQQILQTGHAARPSGYESTIQVDDAGDTRVFLPRTIPITAENQQPIGTTVVLADVTGLRRLDEMKNGLLALVSHELKTPLTGMRMVLHLVTDGRVGSLTPKQKELLDSARDDAERLHTIVDNLLDMARIESGRALMELQPVSPAVLATRAAESLRGAFESQQVALSIAASDGLPLVSADPTRISHVLINLLYNSLRYTPAGGHVRIWARPADDWVEMGVTDDGAGIPRQFLPRIFEKFFRAPGQRGGGSGLGLSIAKDIVEAHGGHIRAESVEEKGSTFSFTLRRAIHVVKCAAER